MAKKNFEEVKLGQIPVSEEAIKQEEKLLQRRDAAFARMDEILARPEDYDSEDIKYLTEVRRDATDQAIDSNVLIADDINFLEEAISKVKRKGEGLLNLVEFLNTNKKATKETLIDQIKKDKKVLDVLKDILDSDDVRNDTLLTSNARKVLESVLQEYATEKKAKPEKKGKLTEAQEADIGFLKITIERGKKDFTETQIKELEKVIAFVRNLKKGSQKDAVADIKDEDIEALESVLKKPEAKPEKSANVEPEAEKKERLKEIEKKIEELKALIMIESDKIADIAVEQKKNERMGGGNYGAISELDRGLTKAKELLWLKRQNLEIELEKFKEEKKRIIGEREMSDAEKDAAIRLAGEQEIKYHAKPGFVDPELIFKDPDPKETKQMKKKKHASGGAHKEKEPEVDAVLQKMEKEILIKEGAITSTLEEIKEIDAEFEKIEDKAGKIWDKKRAKLEKKKELLLQDIKEFEGDEYKQKIELLKVKRDERVKELSGEKSPAPIENAPQGEVTDDDLSEDKLLRTLKIIKEIAKDKDDVAFASFVGENNIEFLEDLLAEAESRKDEDLLSNQEADFIRDFIKTKKAEARPIVEAAPAPAEKVEDQKKIEAEQENKITTIQGLTKAWEDLVGKDKADGLRQAALKKQDQGVIVVDGFIFASMDAYNKIKAMVESEGAESNWIKNYARLAETIANPDSVVTEEFIFSNKQAYQDYLDEKKKEQETKEYLKNIDILLTNINGFLDDVEKYPKENEHLKREIEDCKRDKEVIEDYLLRGDIDGLRNKFYAKRVSDEIMYLLELEGRVLRPLNPDNGDGQTVDLAPLDDEENKQAIKTPEQVEKQKRIDKILSEIESLIKMPDAKIFEKDFNGSPTSRDQAIGYLERTSERLSNTQPESIHDDSLTVIEGFISGINGMLEKLSFDLPKVPENKERVEFGRVAAFVKGELEPFLVKLELSNYSDPRDVEYLKRIIEAFEANKDNEDYLRDNWADEHIREVREEMAAIDSEIENPSKAKKVVVNIISFVEKLVRKNKESGDTEPAKGRNNKRIIGAVAAGVLGMAAWLSGGNKEKDVPSGKDSAKPVAKATTDVDSGTIRPLKKMDKVEKSAEAEAKEEKIKEKAKALKSSAEVLEKEVSEKEEKEILEKEKKLGKPNVKIKGYSISEIRTGFVVKVLEVIDVSENFKYTSEKAFESKSSYLDQATEKVDEFVKAVEEYKEALDIDIKNLDSRPDLGASLPETSVDAKALAEKAELETNLKNEALALNSKANILLVETSAVNETKTLEQMNELKINSENAKFLFTQARETAREAIKFVNFINEAKPENNDELKSLESKIKEKEVEIDKLLEKIKIGKENLQARAKESLSKPAEVKETKVRPELKIGREMKESKSALEIGLSGSKTEFNDEGKLFIDLGDKIDKTAYCLSESDISSIKTISISSKLPQRNVEKVKAYIRTKCEKVKLGDSALPESISQRLEKRIKDSNRVLNKKLEEAKKNKELGIASLEELKFIERQEKKMQE